MQKINFLKIGSDYAYSSSENLCDTMERPECDESCPQYDEYDETCGGPKTSTFSRKFEQRIIGGATYAGGSTPWLVALDWSKDEVDLGEYVI